MRIRKDIPKDILTKIKEKETSLFGLTLNRTRYYPYFELQGGKLAISTVAARYGKSYPGKKVPTVYIKKVTVHVLGEKRCYCRDIMYRTMAGYTTDFEVEKELDGAKVKYLVNYHEQPSYWWADATYFRLFRSHVIVNPEFLTSIEEFKYCAWDGIMDVLDYLEKYQANPRIEIVSKMLGNRLAMSDKIIKLAEKEKGFVAFLKKNKDELEHRAIPVILTAYKNCWTLQEAQTDYDIMQEFKARSRGVSGELKTLYCTADRKEKEKILNFLKRNDVNYHHYNDYLTAIKELGLDMTDTKNLFPKDFKRWERIRLNQYATFKAEQDKKKKAELIKKIKDVANKYSKLACEESGFVLIIADSKASLIREGNALKHCVGKLDYDQKIANEQSLIFFLRREEEKDKPYVTIEYSLKEKKVRQCYAERNTKPTDDVMEFVDAWQKKAKRRLRYIKNVA